MVLMKPAHSNKEVCCNCSNSCCQKEVSSNNITQIYGFSALFPSLRDKAMPRNGNLFWVIYLNVGLLKGHKKKNSGREQPLPENKPNKLFMKNTLLRGCFRSNF